MNPLDDKKPEDQSAPAPAGPGVGGVMDVKPPKPEVPSPVPVGPVASERSEAMPEEPAPDVHVEQPASEPAAQTASTEQSAAAESTKAGLSPDLLAEAKKEVEKKSPETPDQIAAHASKKKGNVPLAAIAVAIVVALLLSGAAVFAYLKTKDSGANKPSVVNKTNQPSAATSSDVDEASKAVEDAANTTGADKDLPDSELSEQTLGL